MIIVRVDIATHAIKRAFANLNKDQVAKATSAAINRTLSKGQTEIRKEIRKVYNIKAIDLKGIKANKAKPTRLEGNISIEKKPISLTRFNPSFTYIQAGKSRTIRVKSTKQGLNKTSGKARTSSVRGLTVEIKKGQRVLIPYAFLVRNDTSMPVFARGNYKSGDNYGFVKRIQRSNNSGPDTPITKLLSISASSAGTNKRVQKELNSSLMSFYKERLNAELQHRVNQM